MASKYDEERKKMGMQPGGTTSGFAVSAQPQAQTKPRVSRYAAERERMNATIQNPIAIQRYSLEELNKSSGPQIQQSTQGAEPIQSQGISTAGQRMQDLREQRAGRVDTQQSFGQRAMDTLRNVGQALDDFPAEFTNTATLGLSNWVGRELFGQETMEEQKERSERIGGKIGGFAGYLMPGSAIEKGVGLVAKPLVQNLPRWGRLAATGATAGVIEGAAQEGGDVAFRGGTFDPLNVAIGGAAGGVANPLLDVTGRAIGRFAQRRAGQAAQPEAVGPLRSLSQEPQPTQPNVEPQRPVVQRNPQPIAQPENSTTLDDMPETLGELVRRTKGRETPVQAPKPTQLPNVTTRAETAATASGNRAFMNTLVQSDKLSDDVRTRLQTSPARNYEIARNVDTVAAANSRINDGLDSAEAFVLSGEKSSAEQIATGMRLIDELQKTNNIERAVTIAETLAKKLTEAGQTVQAASIWNRLTPEGALVAAQRKVAEINRKSTKLEKPIELTKETADDIMEAAGAIQRNGASQTRAQQVMDITDRLKKGETVSPEDKQIVEEFVKDLSQFVKKERAPRPPRMPKEMDEPRIRDKVLSVLEEQERKAVERLKAKGIRVSANPLDVWADMAYVLALRLAKGTIKATDATEAMVKEFGEAIRPHMAGIIDKAHEIIEKNTKKVSRGTAERVSKAASRLTDEEIAEQTAQKAALEELTKRVREAIQKSKDGTITTDELQAIRDLSEDVAQIPSKARALPEEKRFESQVKTLAKKLAEVKTERQPTSQSLREVSKLVREVAKLTDGPAPKGPEIDKAINDLAYGLKERTKPRVPGPQEKIAESYIKKNADRLRAEDIDLIRKAAMQVTDLAGEQKRVASQELQAILNGFEKAGFWRKVSAAQYISMLLNPKTQVRNIVGNELLYRLERFSRLIATPIDIAASKVTGGKRTVTFKSGPRIWDDFFMPAKDFWTNLPKGMSAGWRGVSPEGLNTKYEIQGLAFRSKVWGALGVKYLEKSLGATLQGFDYAAYTRATNQRLREMAYLDAINNGVKGADNIRSHMQTYMANLDDAVHDIAKNYGKYATLQDDSTLARKIMGFRRGLNKITTGSENFGVGSLAVPFAKTPANLLLRGLDYSPIGILKAVKQASELMLKKETDLTRADVISSVSRAIMGTGMGALAYWLADKGAMWGQSNDDPEARKLQQLVGIRDFQLNATAFQRMLKAMAEGGDIDKAAKLQKGDTLWTYEWAQPTSMPMAIGSNVYQGVKQKQGVAQTAGEAVFAGVGTLLDSSVMSGIREAFQVPPGEENAWKAIVMNLAKQAPSMFTPSLMRNINTFRDGTVKETYSPNQLDAFFAQPKSNIPGLSQQLPQRVNTLGQPQTRPNTFFDVFVSPSDRAKYDPSPEAQFVMDLLTETGNTGVAPRAVKKYIDGTDIKTNEYREIDLTPEQYVRLQTLVGQETVRLIGKINPNLPTEKKVQKVIEALDAAGKQGRNELKKELGLRKTK